MCAESEKLIEWAKEQFTTMITCDFSWKDEKTIENCKKMCRLLNKFKSVEKQLTSGGVIQDILGNLCQSGDKIREVGYDEREGILIWDSVQRCFCFDWDNISDHLNEMDFEKIEG